jgi:hypothetical protein
MQHVLLLASTVQALNLQAASVKAPLYYPLGIGYVYHHHHHHHPIKP